MNAPVGPPAHRLPVLTEVVQLNEPEASRWPDLQANLPVLNQDVPAHLWLESRGLSQRFAPGEPEAARGGAFVDDAAEPAALSEGDLQTHAHANQSDAGDAAVTDDDLVQEFDLGVAHELADEDDHFLDDNLSPLPVAEVIESLQRVEPRFANEATQAGDASPDGALATPVPEMGQPATAGQSAFAPATLVSGAPSLAPAEAVVVPNLVADASPVGLVAAAGVPAISTPVARIPSDVVPAAKRETPVAPPELPPPAFLLARRPSQPVEPPPATPLFTVPVADPAPEPQPVARAPAFASSWWTDDSEPVVAEPALAPEPAAAAAPVPLVVTPTYTEAQVVQRVLSDLDRQIDAMFEHRVHQVLGPVLARAADALVSELRRDLSQSLRDMVARAVAIELARHPKPPGPS